MPAALKLTGQRFGRLVALSTTTSTPHGVRWMCRCDCGISRDFLAAFLKSGESTSCGCKAIERVIQRNTTHGMRHTREYSSWASAKNRCHNVRAARWTDYGGRGISMCEHWRHSFEAFYADMGQRPKNTSLDRIDNNGHYEPANCHWATFSQQRVNSRRDDDDSRKIKLAWNGHTRTLREWSRVTGLPYYLINRRHFYKWSAERILTTPHTVKGRGQVV